MAGKTKITYFGHSMFLIESKNGLKIGMDPYNERIKSKLPDVSADIAIVSHAHFDHSNAGLFKGSPEIIDRTGKYTKNEASITGYPSFHDNMKGRLRGENIIFAIEIDNIRFVHLGDFGSFSDNDTVNLIKGADVLFIPVGGIFTINFKEAAKLVEIIRPKIAVPMHFREKDLKLMVEGINPFKNAVKNYPVKEQGSSLEISAGEIPSSTEIWIMHGCD